MLIVWYAQIYILYYKCLQRKAQILIQLNADSLYSFACWSLCLLCLLFLMVIIVILLKRRSILIVYYSGDRKLINAYLSTKTDNTIRNINLQKCFLEFWKDVLSNMPQCAYISLFTYFILKFTAINSKSECCYAN